MYSVYSVQAEKQHLPRMSSAYAFIADPAGSAVGGPLQAPPSEPYPDQTAPGLSIAALTSGTSARVSTMVQLIKYCCFMFVCMLLMYDGRAGGTHTALLVLSAQPSVKLRTGKNNAGLTSATLKCLSTLVQAIKSCQSNLDASCHFAFGQAIYRESVLL